MQVADFVKPGIIIEVPVKLTPVRSVEMDRGPRTTWVITLVTLLKLIEFARSSASRTLNATPIVEAVVALTVQAWPLPPLMVRPAR
jgi:hypothetical protein